MTFPSSLNSGCVKALASLTASLMALIPVLMFLLNHFSVNANLTISWLLCSTKNIQTPSSNIQRNSKLQAPIIPHALAWRLAFGISLVLGGLCLELKFPFKPPAKLQPASPAASRFFRRRWRLEPNRRADPKQRVPRHRAP